MSNQSGPPAEQTQSAQQPHPEPPGRRRGISPIAGFLILVVLVLIAIPTITWLASRSGGSGKHPVLLAGRPLAAFSILAPGDLKMDMREVAASDLPVELPLATTIVLKDVAEGAMLTRLDVASMGSAVDLPRNPVAIRTPEPATLPTSATIGGRVTIYGVLGKQRFSVDGVLLSREKGPVFLVSRDDARNFGAVLATGKVVTTVEVVSR